MSGIVLLDKGIFYLQNCFLLMSKYNLHNDLFIRIYLISDTYLISANPLKAQQLNYIGDTKCMGIVYKDIKICLSIVTIIYYMDQSVMNEKLFLANFEQRLKDTFIQNCTSDRRRK